MRHHEHNSDHSPTPSHPMVVNNMDTMETTMETTMLTTMQTIMQTTMATITEITVMFKSSKVTT